MNEKKELLVVNTNMVKMFMALEPDYSIMTASLPPLVLIKKISGCSYIHALLFATKQDRDKAFRIMTQYGIDKKVKYPYVYLGEKVTSEMITLLNEKHGNFSVWQKIETINE